MNIWHRAKLSLIAHLSARSNDLMVKIQKQLLVSKDAEIAELHRCVLAHQHALRDMAVAFRLALESPEIDIKDDLDEMIRSLSDDVSKLEEHVL